MKQTSKIFRVELVSKNPLWWHFDLFISIICRSESGDDIAHVNTEDAQSSLSCTTKRPSLVLLSEPCSAIDLYIYAVAAHLPASKKVSDSPPFSAQVSVTAAGEEPRTIELAVNQWGGAILSAERFE